MDTISYTDVIIKTTLTFLVLLVVARLLGKKQQSQPTYFNYITGLTLGSIAGNMIFRESEMYYKILVGLSIWCILTMLTGYLSLKSMTLRILLNGQPTIVIKRGKIDKQALARFRLNVNDLKMLLRMENIFSIKDVEYAVFETTGKLSILRVPNKQTAVKEDLKIVTSKPSFIPTSLIIDGNFIKHNLKEANITKEWVITQLDKNGYSDYKKILYAELQEDGSIAIDTG